MEVLPSPPERLTLGAQLGGGVFGRVYRASDGGARVAVKVCGGAGAEGARRRHALAELAAVRAARHQNLVMFHGAYLDASAAGGGDVWFVMELCSCSALELARSRLAAGARMEEDHIAFILKEIIKALIYLHENNIIHGNVRCSNVLLNCDGEVKLSDFALSRAVTGELGKRHTGIGSPAWMAPEVVAASDESGGGGGGYDARADVWALGVTAIELAEGRAPYQGMHPTRALFQIARNPPPTLEKPSNSSQLLNDFIQECLVKNPEHRPFVVELLEHPFIQAVPENDFYLTQELKKLSMDMEEKKRPNEKVAETIINDGLLWKEGSAEPEALQVEDLASLAEISEESVLRELQRRWERGDGAVYIGDTLLALNPPSAVADTRDQVSEALHDKYECASLADNAPHVFGVADGAYQRALHHREPQHLVLCGETGSGKSALAALALRHLAHLGRVRARADLAARVCAAAAALRVASAAATPAHARSTRALHRATVTYSASGKLSGAVFAVHMLDKWRVSSTDMSQANFDLLYFFYDAMEAEKQLEKYKLEPGRAHRYLRVHERPGREEAGARARGARDAPPADNAASYREFIAHLTALQWAADEVDALQRLLAAVLVLGNVRFEESGEVANPETAARAAGLLGVDCAKFSWALLNYCSVEEAGRAARRRRGSDAARDARDSLAAALYARFVDSLVNRINHKLSLSRAVFGDPISVSIVDMFGFESFRRNRLEQLIVNTTNEQLHFLYCQRTFAWERRDARDEGLGAGGEADAEPRYYDNRAALEQLMGRPLGVFYVVDGASRLAAGAPSAALHYVTSSIRNARCGPHVRVASAGSAQEFCVAHYAGRVTYDAREMADTNRDLLPPELVLALRASTCAAVRALFDAKLTRTGNLAPSCAATTAQSGTGGGDAALWSQTRGVRTAAAVYRATSLELLRQLSGDGGGSGVHFVRCVRAALAPRAGAAARFRADLVRHQLRALAVLEAARARKHGFSCRLPFADFLRRYKFLAFDFDERVEETCDNCRLLLVRLKLEGWRLGRTRVFLKYYHEEYLARLYENQVKKIVKVQSMMRAFLARKAQRDKTKAARVNEPEKTYSTTEEEAAALIQKAYRGYVVRRAYGPLVTQSGDVDEDTARLLRRFAARWRSRSVFQVLLQYRAAAHQRLVHFSQQVHIYNQATVALLGHTSAPAPLERVVARAPGHDAPPPPPPAVWKLPFRLSQLAFRDTADLCAATADGEASGNRRDLEMERWDEPLRSRGGGASEAAAAGADGGVAEALTHVPFCREEAPPPVEAEPVEVKVEPVGVKVEPVEARATSAPRYRPPAPWRAPPAPDADPVRELQTRAAATRAAGDDDAPYDFQAMLRRTPRNRASMKRSGEAEAAVGSGAAASAAAGDGAVGSGEMRLRPRTRLQLAPGIAVLLEGEVAHV